MRKSRVLVVDDSASMRQLIASVLNAAPDIEVVGEACDPLEARQAIKALNPDVVTLDVEMPNMNGLDFLEKLMRLRPMPVIMVSNLTQRGGDITIKALEIGAMDCVTKPMPGDRELFGGLVDKIRLAAEARPHVAATAGGRAPTKAARTGNIAYRPSGRIVAIGSSTGGVEALTSVLSGFPANCPPTVITQHMPGTFTKSFADRLNRLSEASVAEAQDGAPLLPGRIYLAPGGLGRHLEVVGGDNLRCRLRAGDPVSGHCPSVDALFRSVAKVAGSNALGVILTGMGRDGADGLLAMRQAGARTLGQDAATSLIYGMPRTAFEAGGVEKQLSLGRIGAEILTLTTH
ncbi:MAG TPA: chemotaxis response regulator protein-glutamate methylesterase [Lichenihabitans sp.]|jgi:two-component system chemotaxis response regulator CheB|nr:chemotaxis response regulator protein-glutamate methylesterase [Lichenihabitans sp.]